MTVDMIHEVVEKLIGKVFPAGSSDVDYRRLENLTTLTLLVDKLLEDISVVATQKDRIEYSMKRAGMYAGDFLKNVSEEYPVADDHKFDTINDLYGEDKTS